MDPTFAREILQEGLSILLKLDIHHWLSGGTALGLYRDGLSDEFLLRDTDIDIGVLGDSRYTDIKAAFENKKFITFRTYKTNGQWSQLAFTKNGIIFDIYFFVTMGDIVVNQNESGIMGKPLYMIEDLEIIRDCPLPSPIEKYLDLRYGPEWRIQKVKSIRWENDAANLLSWGSQ